MGTSKIYCSSVTLSEDHPHACGDKYENSTGLLQGGGSSPRVWGQAPTGGNENGRFRIIPTRVGTRHFKPLSFIRSKDHPHACGDKKKTTTRRKRSKGSSPRVWGQVHFVNPFVNFFRIIPTRVGTSRTSS